MYYLCENRIMKNHFYNILSRILVETSTDGIIFFNKITNGLVCLAGFPDSFFRSSGYKKGETFLTDFLFQKTGNFIFVDSKDFVYGLFKNDKIPDKVILSEVVGKYRDELNLYGQYILQSEKNKFADYIGIPVIIKDTSGHLIYGNSEAAGFLNSDYEIYKNINEHYLNVFDTESSDTVGKFVSEAVAEEKSERVFVKKNDGTIFKVNSYFIKEDDLIIDFFFPEKVNSGNEDDLSEKFSQLVEAYDNLAFFLNKNGYFQAVNTNGSHLLGYKAEEMIGKHFLEFVSDDDKAEIALTFQNILSSRKHLPFEANLIDCYSNKILFQIFGNPVYSNNRVTGFLGFAKDLSKIKILEEKINRLNSKLIESNRLISIEKDRAREQVNVIEEINKLKNEFISNISHELRTPLASIVGFAETINSDNTLPHEMIQEFSSIILNEGKRLAKLVNDILDFSKLENLEDALVAEEFDLVLFIKDLIKEYIPQADKKAIRVNTEIPEAEIIISADKEKIKKAFGIILSNSVKFNNQGGRVNVIVKDFLNEFEVIIIDTGIGIAESEIPKLFQKFSKIQTNYQNPSSGFGLVTAKQIIDMHKGIIRVKSEVNKGSSFIIRLPKK